MNLTRHAGEGQHLPHRMCQCREAHGCARATSQNKPAHRAVIIILRFAFGVINLLDTGFRQYDDVER